MDLCAEQWDQVVEVAAAQGWLPFLVAYQGFGMHVADRAAVEKFAVVGVDFLIASSFRKTLRSIMSGLVR